VILQRVSCGNGVEWEDDFLNSLPACVSVSLSYPHQTPPIIVEEKIQVIILLVFFILWDILFLILHYNCVQHLFKITSTEEKIYCIITTTNFDYHLLSAATISTIHHIIYFIFEAQCCMSLVSSLKQLCLRSYRLHSINK
jgi:hypothetical protein